VADIRGQRIDDVVDSLVLLVTAQESSADESVAQVVDAWACVAAARPKIVR
jgi:hypothetical protein